MTVHGHHDGNTSSPARDQYRRREHRVHAVNVDDIRPIFVKKPPHFHISADVIDAAAEREYPLDDGVLQDSA
jgi:hypothetical protein